jgi:hypothetical protein
MKDTAFGHYLSGLTDGEGSFILQLQRQYGREHPRASFVIAMRHDDEPILNQIVSFLGCGSIYHSTRSCTMSHLMIFRPDDLYHRALPNFHQFPLRAKKSKDFVIWEQAVILIYTVRQRRQLGGNGAGPRKKWTPDDRSYFGLLMEKMKYARSTNVNLAKDNRPNSNTQLPHPVHISNPSAFD